MSSDEKLIRADEAVALLAPLTAIVAKACDAILAVDRNAIDIVDKSDGSPVTKADLAADRTIAEGLVQLLPGVPILSEERTHEANTVYRGSFIIVDPLDGTKEFIAGRDEFTVNLAIVTEGIPLLGIVAAPALALLWRGVVGRYAERLDLQTGDTIAIRTRTAPPPGAAWIAAISRSHGDAATDSFIDDRPGARRLQAGSALKFCRVAEGNADIYPRLAPTGEWDVAAGHALVTAAGGKVTDGSRGELRFGRTSAGDFLVPKFVAYGDPSAAD